MLLIGKGVACANCTVLTGCRVRCGTAHHVRKTGFSSTVVCFPFASCPIQSAIGSLRSPGAIGSIGSADDVLTSLRNRPCCSVYVHVYLDSRYNRVLRACVRS